MLIDLLKSSKAIGLCPMGMSDSLVPDLDPICLQRL